MFFFGNSLSEFCLTHRDIAIICGCFYSVIQNLEKSKASVVEVVSCFATVKARIQERQSDVHIRPS